MRLWLVVGCGGRRIAGSDGIVENINFKCGLNVGKVMS